MIIDLSQCGLFSPNGNWRGQYGDYDPVDQTIYGVHGWPDWTPYVKVDAATTYTVRIKYNPLSTHDAGGRAVYVTGVRPDHIIDDYYQSGHFGEIWDDDDSDSSDDHTFTIGPGISNWDDATYGPAQGYTMLYLETSNNGAVSYLEITPDPIPVDPTPWPENILLTAASDSEAPAAEAGDSRPYYGRYWAFQTDTEQDVSLDTFASTATDLSNADTQIWVFRNADSIVHNYIADNDDADTPPDDDHSLLSQVTFHALANIEYHILVGTYGTDGDGITAFVLTGAFGGDNIFGGGGGPPPPHDPDPPDPEAAYYHTEIVSTLMPTTGTVPASYVWTQVSPGTPVVVLHPDHNVLRFENPTVTADTDFVFRLTITDNLGGTVTEDHTVHVKAHDYWTIKDGVLHGIQQVHTLAKQYLYTTSTRSVHDLEVPYTTVTVSDENGWLATFTTGCRSVLIRREDDAPALTGLDAAASTFAPTTRLLMLPAAFTGTVDEILLEEMHTVSRMDLYDMVYAMVNNNVTMVNGVQVFGPNDYDATADFNDYLGITFGGDAPDMAKTGKISPAGFIRLIYGEVGLGLSTTTIPTDPFQQAQAGYGMQVIDIETYAPNSHMLGFLQMGDVLGFTDPVSRHVGIYLGTDSAGVRRFVSLRQDKNGASAADKTTTPKILSTVLPYKLPTPGQYPGWLKGARRY